MIRDVRKRFDKACMGVPRSIERWRLINRMFSAHHSNSDCMSGAAYNNSSSCSAAATMSPFASVPHITLAAVEMLLQITAVHSEVFCDLVKHKILSRHYDVHTTYTFSAPMMAAYVRSVYDQFNESFVAQLKEQTEGEVDSDWVDGTAVVQ